MNTFSKIVLIAFSVIMASLLYAEGDAVDTPAEGDAVDTPPPINPKFLKLSVKKICQKRKIKSKDPFPKSEAGIDYSHDDKSDNVQLTITVDNRNKVDANDYTITVDIYGKSAVEKRPTPVLYKDFAIFIPEIAARKKYIKVLGKDKDSEIRMVYDKSEDTYEESSNNRNGSNTTRIFKTPAFGQYFYGYKVTLLDKKEKVVQTVLWPSSLKKALEKLKQKTEKEKAKK